MSRIKSFALTLIGLAFVVTGGLIFAHSDSSEDRLMAIFVIVFFGGCALVGLSDLLPARMPAAGSDGRMVVRPSRVRAGLFAFAGIGFMLGGAFVLIEILNGGVTLEYAIGALALPFGVAVLLIMSKQAIAPETLYVLDSDGIASLQGLKWQLAWTDIAAIGVGGVQHTRWLVFETFAHVPDPPGKRTGLNRRFGMPPYAMTSGASGIAFEPLAETVFSLWEARMGPAAN